GNNEADLLAVGIELRTAFAKRDPLALLACQVKLTQLAAKVSVVLLQYVILQVEGWKETPVSVGECAAEAPAPLVAEITVAVTERVARGLQPPASGREVLN